VKRSAEVRWFYHSDLPHGVQDWFCGSKLCKEEEARSDRYLVLSGSNEVGIKLRGGRKFQIKGRTRSPEPFSLETSASVGRQDAWIKWSLKDSEAVARLAAVGSDSSEWVLVDKKRWIRKFHLDAAGSVEEVDAGTKLEHGCQAELAEVTVRESHWWTLAFESFGEGDRTTILEQVARHFLKVLPHGLALTERDSMAYPEWLNRLAV
jgi:hypothetical protein